MTRAIALSCALWALCPAAAALAEVRLDVRADRNRVSIDETLTVQIRIETRGMGSPSVDLPQFEGFQIVSQQVQRPMQFSFNFGSQAVVQSSTIYTLALQPQRTGKLVIKPVRVEFEGQVKTSRPIEVEVAGGAGSNPSDDEGPGQAARGQEARPNSVDNAEIDSMAFLRAVADKSEPYEGEQVTVTIYLYVRERLQAMPEIETAPTTNGLWTHDLLTPDQPLRPERQVVGNTVYAVYVLRRFAAFPLQSGEVTIGPMAVEIDTTSLFDMFAPGRARPSLKRASAPLTLKVKPLPADGRPAGEIAVGRYDVSAKLDRTQVMTGDAVTLSAVVEGQGNMRAVQLRVPEIPNVDVLEPEVKDLVEAPRDVVGGRREYRWLLLARAPGRVAVPALEVATFDPRTGRYERRSSEPLTFEALGQARPLPQPTDTAPDGADGVSEPAGVDRHEWAPIRTRSALRRGERALVERSWYPWAVAAPGVLWLIFVSVSAARRRLRARAQSGATRVLRAAETRLQAATAAAAKGDAAQFHGHAYAAVIGVLDARLQEPVGGLTRTQLRAHLGARGMDPALVEAAVQVLQDCEFARFGSAPASSAELAGQAQALTACFKRLANWKPSGATSATEAA